MLAMKVVMEKMILKGTKKHKLQFDSTARISIF